MMRRAALRISRVKGKTLFEMSETEPALLYICDMFLSIADALLSEPEGVVPRELGDRALFRLLSDFSLSPSNETKKTKTESEESANNLDFFLV